MPNITIDGKDAVWMNKTIKLNIKAKNNVYNKYIENGRFDIGFSLFETLITELNKLINTAKAFYYQKLSKNLITYWSILKTFYNKKNSTKFVAHIKTKACIFNNIFAEQLKPFKNDSLLAVQSRLSSLDFNDD